MVVQSVLTEGPIQGQNTFKALQRYPWAWYQTNQMLTLGHAMSSFKGVPYLHPYVAGVGSSILPRTPMKNIYINTYSNM